MEDEFFIIDYYRMACIVATLVSCNYICLLRKEINDFSFSLVSPLCTYYDNIRHNYLSYSVIRLRKRTFGRLFISSKMPGVAGLSIVTTEIALPPGASLPNCILAILILFLLRRLPLFQITPGLSLLCIKRSSPSGTISILKPSTDTIRGSFLLKSVPVT